MSRVSVTVITPFQQWSSGSGSGLRFRAAPGGLDLARGNQVSAAVLKAKCAFCYAPDVRAFIAMEYLQGKTFLRHTIAGCPMEFETLLTPAIEGCRCTGRSTLERNRRPSRHQIRQRLREAETADASSEKGYRQSGSGITHLAARQTDQDQHKPSHKRRALPFLQKPELQSSVSNRYSRQNCGHCKQQNQCNRRHPVYRPNSAVSYADCVARARCSASVFTARSSTLQIKTVPGDTIDQ